MDALRARGDHFLKICYCFDSLGYPSTSTPFFIERKLLNRMRSSFRGLSCSHYAGLPGQRSSPAPLAVENENNIPLLVLFPTAAQCTVRWRCATCSTNMEGHTRLHTENFRCRPQGWPSGLGTHCFPHAQETCTRLSFDRSWFRVVASHQA